MSLGESPFMRRNVTRAAMLFVLMNPLTFAQAKKPTATAAASSAAPEANPRMAVTSLSEFFDALREYKTNPKRIDGALNYIENLITRRGEEDLQTLYTRLKAENVFGGDAYRSFIANAHTLGMSRIEGVLDLLSTQGRAGKIYLDQEILERIFSP